MSPILAILLLLFFKSHAFFLPPNSSVYPFSLNPEPPPLSASSSPDSFLSEILETIAAEERWDPSAGIRVSELDPISFRVGSSQRYQFLVRAGRRVLMLKFSDGVASWTKPEREWAGFGLDLDLDGGFDEDLKPAVRVLELQGPLDLRVAGDSDELSLSLPALNVTRGGLRRILIGDGTTIKVEGAQEVTVFHPTDIGLSLVKANQQGNQFWRLGLPSCALLLSIRVAGSSSVVAFRTHNSEAYVRTVFHRHDTIELLSEKCYYNGRFKPVLSWPFGFLSSKLALLDKAVASFMGYDILQGGTGTAQLLRAKITSSNLVKFRLEVERYVTENDRAWKRVAEWRTKPSVERVWFEIVTRVEAGKLSRQIIVRKLTRPIMSVESSPWSNLMSNISFTQIPSIVLPPEALTLDVHW